MWIFTGHNTNRYVSEKVLQKKLKQKKQKRNSAGKNKTKHEHGLVVWCQHKNTTLEKRAIFF